MIYLHRQNLVNGCSDDSFHQYSMKNATRIVNEKQVIFDNDGKK